VNVLNGEAIEIGELVLLASLDSAAVSGGEC